MRISENDTGLSTPGFTVRASVSTMAAQLLRPSGAALHVDPRILQCHVGDFVAPHQQRQQAQVGGQFIDGERLIGNAAAARTRAFQSDLPQGDGTAGENRDTDVAVDLEVETGRRTNLVLDRKPARRSGRSSRKWRSGRSARQRETPQSASRGALSLGPSSMSSSGKVAVCGIGGLSCAEQPQLDCFS